MAHTPDEIMHQAQVYASAWSLVGGAFDDGSFHDAALEEKCDLKAMLEAQAAEIEKLTVQRDDARFALRKLKEHIQGDCV